MLFNIYFDDLRSPMLYNIYFDDLRSPMLYNIYFDDLSTAFNKCNVGCCFNAIVHNHLYYADNLCLLSPSVHGLNELISISAKYTTYHNIVFNEPIFIHDYTLCFTGSPYCIFSYGKFSYYNYISI